MLTRTSIPTGLPVTIADVKRHAVIDHTEDDAQIASLLSAAVRLFEERTGRVLLPTGFEQRFNGWCDTLILDAAPLRSVTSLSYLDSDDVEQSIASAGNWYWVATPAGGELRFVSSWSAPTLSARANPVIVSFDAGHDDPDASGAGDDPELAQDPRDAQALKMLVTHWYEGRGATSGNSGEIPFGVESIMRQRRIFL